MLININDHSYDKIIEKSLHIPVIIYFYSNDSYVPEPLDLEKVSKEFGNKIIIAKYNVKESNKRQDITTVPCIKLFKNKKEMAGFVGNIPEEGLIEWIKSKI